MRLPLISPRRGAVRAFTLIELLAVIAIIGVLAGITFGVVKGVNERAAISLARTELSVLSQKLTDYKGQYGDFPRTGRSAGTPTATATAASVEGLLFNALMGKVGPKLDAIQGKQFLEASKFTLQTTNLPTPGNTTSVANALLDPWGRLYLYYYKTSAANGGGWNNSTYYLVSAGPDGLLGITVGADGSLTVSNATQEADNIYANR